MKVREALEHYLARYSFGKTPGGYEDKWARIEVGKIALWFPNFDARREVAKRHDINHILTGYPPINLKGEMEIAFFELASGCGKFWAAWYFNGMATLMGIWWPKAAWRAFRRGRMSKRSLYLDYNYDDQLLDMPLETLRAELGIG